MRFLDLRKSASSKNVGQSHFWVHLCNFSSAILLVRVRDPNSSTYFLDLDPNLVSWLRPESMNLVSWLRPESMRFLDLRKSASSKNVGQSHFWVHLCNFSSAILLVRVRDPNPSTYFLDLDPNLVSWLRPRSMNLVSWLRPKSMRFLDLRKSAFSKNVGQSHFLSSFI